MGTGRYTSAASALWDDADITGADTGDNSINSTNDHKQSQRSMLARFKHSATFDPAVWRFGRSRPHYNTPQARGLSIAAQCSLTVAVFLGGYVGWDLGFSDVQARQHQAVASEKIETAWANADVTDPETDPAQVAAGEPLVKLHIPKLEGDVATTTVVQGTTQEALMTGPGYYTGSQWFGDPGNSAIAGHRDGKGAPFHDIGSLRTCDVVAVETNTSWYIYRVLPVGVDDPLADGLPRGNGVGDVDMAEDMRPCASARVRGRLNGQEYAQLRGVSIHTPGDVDVVAPVPGTATIPPEDAGISMLTLTTCHPTWSNAERLIVHAALTEVIEKREHPQGWAPGVITGDDDGTDGVDSAGVDSAGAGEDGASADTRSTSDVYVDVEDSALPDGVATTADQGNAEKGDNA